MSVDQCGNRLDIPRIEFLDFGVLHEILGYLVPLVSEHLHNVGIRTSSAGLGGFENRKPHFVVQDILFLRRRLQIEHATGLRVDGFPQFGEFHIDHLSQRPQERNVDKNTPYLHITKDIYQRHLDIFENPHRITVQFRAVVVVHFGLPVGIFAGIRRKNRQQIVAGHRPVYLAPLPLTAFTPRESLLALLRECRLLVTEVLGNTGFELHIECGIVQMHHHKCIREDRTVFILDSLHDVYHAVELRVVSDHAEPRKILVAQLYDVSDRNGLREKVVDRTEARLLTALVKRETQRNTVVLQTGSLPVPRKKSAGFETLEVLLQFAGTGQQKTLTFI